MVGILLSYWEGLFSGAMFFFSISPPFISADLHHFFHPGFEGDLKLADLSHTVAWQERNPRKLGMLEGIFQGPPTMGPPTMVSGTHTIPISLGIRTWEWD